MQQGSIVVLAIIIGLMLAFDMGGPVNKVAYAFMLICVAQGVYTVVAIAAVAICIPPLGLGPATLINRKNFTGEEREAGKAALVMGCVGSPKGPFHSLLLILCALFLHHAGIRMWRSDGRRDGRTMLCRLGRAHRSPCGGGQAGLHRGGCRGAVVTAISVNVLKSFARKNAKQVEEKEDDRIWISKLTD